MVWGTIIAAYLFCAGVSAGAFLTASYVSRKYPKAGKVRLTGRIISPVIMGIGLLALIFDAEAGLQHPLRFLYLFTNWNSVMTIGTAFISVFMIAAFFIALMEILKKEINKFLEYIGIIFALGTAIYTGFLMGVVSTIPIWNTSVLPVLFFVSALSTGIAATLLFASFFDREAVHQLLSVNRIHFGLMVTEVFLIFTMLAIASSTNEAGAQSTTMLLTGKYSVWFWGGIIIIGLLLPMLIEGLKLLNERKMSHTDDGLKIAASGSPGITGTLITETSVLIGGFILRLLILYAAVPISFIS